MSGWLSNWTEALWRNGLALIPLALAIILVTRWLPCRPATRHSLWLMALLWLLMPPVLPPVSLSDDQGASNVAPETLNVGDNEGLSGLVASDAFPYGYELPGREEPEPDYDELPALATELEVAPGGVASAIDRECNATELTVTRSEGLTDFSVGAPDSISELDVISRLTPVIGATVPLWFSPALHLYQAPLHAEMKRLAAVLLYGAGMAVELRHQSAPARDRVAGDSLAGETDPDIPRLIQRRLDSSDIGLSGRVCRRLPFRVELGRDVNHEADVRRIVSNLEHDKPEPAAARREAASACGTASNEFRPLSPAGVRQDSVDIPPVLVERLEPQTEMGSAHEGASDGSVVPWPVVAANHTSGRVSSDTFGSVSGFLMTNITNQCVAWVSALMRVRDAFGAVPPIPAGIWLGGVLVVFVFGFVRLVLFRMRIRSARRADATVLRLVNEAASKMGLRRAPEVWIGHGRFSPMVWCGLRTRLVLPNQLWSELDDVGRRAVICHELAHVRRRDHRVVWIESIVGCLYWWHPVVWFVRRRLHAEAEVCCDAWVTSLLPRMRRGYASALIKTREFIAKEHHAMPAIGIGITTPRAKRLARRITMVMTESTRPRLTATGFLLALALAGFGWLAAPARSCPNETRAEAKKGCAGAAHATAAEAERKTSFEQYLAGKAAADASDEVRVLLVGDREAAREKMYALEKMIDELSEQLEELEEAFEDDEDGDDDDDWDDDEEERDDDDDDDDEEEERHVHQHQQRHVHQHTHARAFAAPKEPRAPRAPRAPRGLSAPCLQAAPCAPSAPCAPCAPSAPCGPGDGVFAPGPHWGDPGKGEAVWKDYSLSAGKLDAFSKLMVRDDVPILVRPGKGKIGIQATQGQHAIFNAFFQMIDRSDARAEFAPPTNLRFGHNKAHGHGSDCGKGCGNCPLCRTAAELKVKAESIRREAREQVDRVRGRVMGEAGQIRAEALRRAEEARRSVRRHARNARAEARAQEDVIQELEHQADRLRRQADRMRDRADRVRDRAESIREKSEDSSDQAPRKTFEDHLRALEDSVRQLADQAGALEERAEMLNQQGEYIHHQIGGLEEHAELLDRRAETIAEAERLFEDDVEVTPELAGALIALAADVEAYTSPAILEALEGVEATMNSLASTFETDVIPAADGISGIVSRALEEVAGEIAAVSESLGEYDDDEGENGHEDEDDDHDDDDDD